MAGALAWPTTGAEVRPWFLLPQRWPPPPPGPLPVPGIPGWGPLSLHARLENISLFLSSHFIIFPPLFSPPLSYYYSLEKFFTEPEEQRERERERELETRTHPWRETSFRFTSQKVLFNVPPLLRGLFANFRSAPLGISWISWQRLWSLLFRLSHYFSSRLR